MSRSGAILASVLAVLLAAPCTAWSGEGRGAKLIAVLKSDAPHEKKAEACRQLAGIGGPAATPVLAGLLTDPKLSHMARYALEPSPDPAAGKALRDALATLKGDLLLGAVHSVGVRRDAEAVGALTELLGGADTDLAAAAAGALGRIAAADAADALAKARKTAPKALRPAVADASLRAAQALLSQGQRDLALAIYENLGEKSWPPHVRLGAFRGLLAADPAAAAPRVMEATVGRDPLLRAAAIAAIPTLGGKDVVAQFAAELTEMPPEVQVLLIRALARRPDAEAALSPMHRLALTSPNAEVRLAAVEAHGAIGNAASVALMCAVLDLKKSAAETRAAAAGLRALKGKGVNDAILACMGKATPATRAELIAALADRKAVEAVDELLRRASEQDRGVRTAALKALGLLAEPKHLPALLGLLASLKSDAGRGDAERAIVQASRKLAKAQADPALAALGKAADAATRGSLLRVLGAIADAKALEAVQAAVGDKDGAVGDAAVRVLAEWPDARPLSTLAALFRTTDSPTHRVLALRGCVRLLSLGSTPPEEALRLYADLATQAKRAEDRKLVLSGLAQVADPAALGAIEPFLKDPATRGEAELALLAVARAVVGAAPAEAEAAAKRLATQTKSAAVRKQAAAIAQAAALLADYVTAWQVTGPYTETGKDGAALIDVAFPPETPDAKGVAWRPLPVATGGKQPWMLELHPLFGGPDRAAYVRTWIHADTAGPALLEFGTDDGSKVWLNGKLVHADGTGGAATPGEHKVRVKLLKGWNPLVLKITQYSGPWQFCLRIRGAKGEKLSGLRVRPAPPGP